MKHDRSVHPSATDEMADLADKPIQPTFGKPPSPKQIVIILSMLLGLSIVGIAIYTAKHQPTDSSDFTVNTAANRSISKQELSEATGKNGKRCYVAVDGMVYEIGDLPHWINGSHTTSEGQAYCGADMTAVIDKAPHGRSMLEQLTTVGTLQK